MPFTSHGHKVPGLAEEGKFEGEQTARCGGPGLCVECSKEAGQALRKAVFEGENPVTKGLPGDAARE